MTTIKSKASKRLAKTNNRTKDSKIQITEKDLVRREDHVAIHMGDSFIVIGGFRIEFEAYICYPYRREITDISLREITEYDCTTEQWHKYLLSPLKKVPPSGIRGMRGVCIDGAVYIYGES